MAVKRQSFLDKLEKELPEQPESIDAPAVRATPLATRTGIHKTTLYVPDAVHERLREIAYTERVKVHDLVMEGIDRVMESRGHPERAGSRKTS